MALHSPLWSVQSWRRRVNFLMGGGPQTYIDKVLGLGPIAYWPLNETSGTTAICQVNSAQNGTYARDVTTMGTAAGIGDGNTSPNFDGINDFVNIFSATLVAAFNGAEGSVMTWVKVANAGVWTDGLAHRAIRLRADGSNRVDIEKHSNNNFLGYTYYAGGVTKARTPNPFSGTDWYCMVMTWSAAADEVHYYLDGVVVAPVHNGLGVWGAPLSAASTVIGAINATPNTPWFGGVVHCPIFAHVLTQPEITNLATV